jgi:hypothetical protein
VQNCIEPRAGSEGYRAFAVVLNLLSTCASMYVAFVAVQAATWNRAENLALLLLFFGGVPALLIQALILLPLTVWCVGKSTSGAPGTRPRWSPYVAALLAAVTLATILTGVVMADINAEQRQRRWDGDANHSQLPISPVPFSPAPSEPE